ncbi:SprT family zinc-dependent metalloprotease [Bartonella sp. TP]|uniref:M48 family metallopeptidase n=1 Tax=Bartonella sp. TP TaxID=3057550 RepID=UPI0025AEE151|nr:SprT family zinc-dependent metalloprotease [Bartonella sp. TP]WJW80459.1 SprT family zinc-dependent metalloprotease [Bartonella sp. TP]
MGNIVGPDKIIYYLGAPYKIVHIGGRGLCHLCAGEIYVPGQPEHLPRRLQDFYHSQAARIMLPIIYEYSEQLGVSFKRVRFKDTRSRWGSASSLGNLSFSWRIMMAPEPIVRYLIAHEVAHLRHMNHSELFWQTCALLCPQWQEYQDWLKRNGEAMMSVVFKNHRG